MSNNESSPDATEWKVPSQPSAPGDTISLEAFLGEWRRRLRMSSRDLLGHDVSARADTSDVAQESILQAWRDLGKFRGASRTEFAAWTRRIGRGHAAKIRRFHLAESRSAKSEATFANETEAPDADPAAQLERRELLQKLAIALEGLEKDLRAVVILRVFADLTFAEVGEELEYSKTKARSLFAQAIKRLHVEIVGKPHESK